MTFVVLPKDRGNCKNFPGIRGADGHPESYHCHLAYEDDRDESCAIRSEWVPNPPNGRLYVEGPLLSVDADG